jgi:thiol-disulfide isomerase/thioredoxin
MSTKHVWLGVAILGSLATVGLRSNRDPQNPSKTPVDAQSFLDGVLKRYESAQTYHVELTEEVRQSTEFSNYWYKRNLTAVLLPDKRFRIEAEVEMGRFLEVSNGTTAWAYLSQIGEYTKKPAPTSGLGSGPSVGIPSMNSLVEARRLLGRISAARAWIRSAKYLPDEELDVKGQPMLCTVVEAKGAKTGASGVNHDVDTIYTFWIGKKDEAIWKETEHLQGPYAADLPHVDYTHDITLQFKVSETNAQAAPAELFFFQPPDGAELVEQFTTRTEKLVSQFQGKQLQSVNLGTRAGETITTDSLRGKPLLLDFWATWCAPCREALPGMEKLYSETADKGLLFVSIDADEDAQTATDFLTKRKDTWMNFHLTKEIASAFPDHGIPYFVLLDAAGKVVYSQEGFDEVRLRSAVSKLSPALSGIVQSPQPAAKP